MSFLGGFTDELLKLAVAGQQPQAVSVPRTVNANPGQNSGLVASNAIGPTGAYTRAMNTQVMAGTGRVPEKRQIMRMPDGPSYRQPTKPAPTPEPAKKGGGAGRGAPYRVPFQHSSSDLVRNVADTRKPVSSSAPVFAGGQRPWRSGGQYADPSTGKTITPKTPTSSRTTGAGGADVFK